MNTLRTIMTTGDSLVEDVKLLYCYLCDGEGVVGERDPQLSDRECPDCHGFGY